MCVRDIIASFLATYWPYGVAAALVMGVVWLIARTRGTDVVKRALLWTALALTVAVLLWLTLALPEARAREGGFNLTPLQEIARAARSLDRPYGIINLYGNLVVFLPVGVLVVWLARGAVWKRVLLATAAGAALSAAIELAQFTAGRIADIDDVILNSVGAFLGACCGSAARAVVYARRARR